MLNELRLSPKAKDDLKLIGHYTYKNFGIKQMEHYLRKIDDGFILIRSEPEIGIVRDEIKKGYRSFSVEKHIIFYRILDTKIDIIGITPGKMDVKSHYSNTKRIS